MDAARGQVQRILDELSDYSVSDEEFQEQLQAGKSNDRAMPITYAEFLLQNPINLVKSQRGNDIAEYLGFLFDNNKLSKPDGKKQYWHCCKHDRKDGGCKARLHTLAEVKQIIQLLGHPGTESGHNHEVDPVADTQEVKTYSHFQSGTAKCVNAGHSWSEWFLKNYVGTVMRLPPFPVYLWSCYERTLAEEDRTNNFAEAAHRRLKTVLGIDHPTMGRFLGEMKQAQKLSDHIYEQCIMGHPAPKKRRIYQEADIRILALVRLFGQNNLMKYLRGLAHNFIMDQ